MPNKYGKCTRDFGAFLFLLVSTFLYFGGVFNKPIIPLALVGYEMIIANSYYAPRWLSIISYPTRARRIIVNYISRREVYVAGTSTDEEAGKFFKPSWIILSLF